MIGIEGKLPRNYDTNTQNFSKNFKDAEKFITIVTDFSKQDFSRSKQARATAAAVKRIAGKIKP